ncbi:sulfite exporter TauE/SafE family protein [Phreatobacter sp. AB_2022a]|uniref:sulfite exporter TauE/SafE family protein n=1 Tax=Phreatobacter sp. AB_2022a TaxID=3003134 RepID=UPI002287131E|nr:sulfite exporter TauE/SafE family protein [Phreatobacter sp. AB_2022a]MCZ0735943.1 sulfite exporter TauE/SafE family protein [Phreatobacter sp. AB_2022a]
MFAALPSDPVFYAVGIAATFLMGLGKGAFGGGLAILGIPLLALVMDPIEASIVTALLVAFMDIFAIGSFPRGAWSKPDLVWLLPGLAGGTFIGFLVFEHVDRRWLALIIALVTLAFTLRYFLKSGAGRPDLPVAPRLALAAGIGTGFTTYIAHAGGPPLAMYLLRRDITKTAYAATTVVVFMMGNLIKLPGFVYSGLDHPAVFGKALALAPVVPIGVFVGRHLNDRLSREKLYGLCYGLVGIAGAKLLVDAIRALWPT